MLSLDHYGRDRVTFASSSSVDVVEPSLPETEDTE